MKACKTEGCRNIVFNKLDGEYPYCVQCTMKRLKEGKLKPITTEQLINQALEQQKQEFETWKAKHLGDCFDEGVCKHCGKEAIIDLEFGWCNDCALAYAVEQETYNIKQEFQDKVKKVIEEIDIIINKLRTIQAMQKKPAPMQSKINELETVIILIKKHFPELEKESEVKKDESY